MVFAVLPEGFAPPRQDFVGIGLVAYVPDDLVIGRIEHLVDGDGYLHGPQACAYMAGILRATCYYIFAEFRAELFELRVVQLLYAGGIVY